MGWQPFAPLGLCIFATVALPGWLAYLAVLLAAGLWGMYALAAQLLGL